MKAHRCRGRYVCPRCEAREIAWGLLLAFVAVAGIVWAILSTPGCC